MIADAETPTHPTARRGRHRNADHSRERPRRSVTQRVRRCAVYTRK
jgi:hypothetical protein